MDVTQEDFDQVFKKVAKEAPAFESPVFLQYLTDNFEREQKYMMDHRFRYLKMLLNDNERFFQYLQEIMRNDRDAESFTKTVENIYECLHLRHNGTHRDGQGTPGLCLEPEISIVSMGTVGVAKFFNSIYSELIKKLLANYDTIAIGNKTLVTKKSLEAGLVKVVLRTTAGPVIAISYISFESTNAIYNYMRGEMSVPECVTKAVMSTAAMGGGYYGGIAASTLANSAGLEPYGPVIAGVAGGIVGGFVAAKIVQYIVLWGFDLTLDKAAQEAYNFLGVTKSTAADKINEKFHHFCRQYHPEAQNGSQDKWKKLQDSMAKIKVARGE